MTIEKPPSIDRIDGGFIVRPIGAEAFHRELLGTKDIFDLGIAFAYIDLQIAICLFQNI